MWSKYFCFRTTSSISTCKSNNQRRKFSYDIIWRWSKEITNLPFVRVQFLEEPMRGIVGRSKGSKDCLWIIQELSFYNLQRGAMTRRYSPKSCWHQKKTSLWNTANCLGTCVCPFFVNQFQSTVANCCRQLHSVACSTKCCRCHRNL